MNIDGMNDQEKSTLLARAMKEPVMSPEFKPINLYAPANMALARKAIEWGAINHQGFREWLQRGGAYQVLVWDDGIAYALDMLVRDINQTEGG